MAKIEAPNKAYSGPGPGGAVFVDGVGETDDEAALNYYRSAGYKVSGKVANPVEDPSEPPDPRELEDEVVGTRLRDAAVDPHDEDFLAPINAGEANPHGPAVVSPEIHASGPAGIRPGNALVDNLGKQETREKEFAEKRLIEQAPAAEAVAAEVDLKDRGELGISDPGSAPQGREAAKTAPDTTAPVPTGDETSERPAKSANKGVWIEYAVSRGAAREDADAMTKAQLVEKYGS